MQTKEQIAKQIKQKVLVISGDDCLKLADWFIEQKESIYHEGYADGTVRKQREIREARVETARKFLHCNNWKLAQEIIKANEY